MLWKLKNAHVFHRPVDISQVPDYLEVVERPMDFGTIKSRLSIGFYKKAADFIKDMELVFDNCILYNAPGTFFADAAEQIRATFEEQCAKNKFQSFIDFDKQLF